MTLVTKAEFARRHGVSKPAVQKWERNGWLVLSEGKVDAEASDAKLAKYRDSKDGRATAKTSKAGGKPHTSKPAQVNRPAPKVLEDETPEQAAERIVRSYGADMPIEEAKRVKENFLALLNQLEYETKSGSLVDLETAKGVLYERAHAARNEWLQWPANVGPLIAAELGIESDRVVEVLTAHVHKQLASLGAPTAEFKKAQ
jgi:hypothetical protein